ncbi:ATP-binding cassette domain-containing protein [Lacisediminihabitans profunda]|uniref:Sugar ABC transporter ATP-binding protein n=1 Tax=Lacisediminihabitans profunda TaxID=2594790 RepID=A0A5C8UKW5_9MICO|nr:ATP-binding cassette domain-containing protein [Lacisediminihabitans profunda]TXN28938.1 sugar ABC transporter ATP-binding protein [Lacisediminihabitans profunda]
MSGTVEPESVVSTRGLNKYFGGVRALADVSVNIHAGQVLALVGDNGAGKSTFTRVISGMDRPDAGQLFYGDELVLKPTARHAQRYGIEVVPQHLALCDNLSAAMNVVLGDPPLRWHIGKFGWIDRHAARELARESVRGVGARLDDYDSPIRRMSGGQRQAIAIGRALLRGGRMVIFDEPTAALGVRQREATLGLIRQVADRGLAAVVISHSIDDVFSVADRIVAFRLGRVVLDSAIEDTDRDAVKFAMEGLHRGLQ